MRFVIILSALSTFIFSFSSPIHKNYPQGYFRLPVNTTIRLSGTFGELRPNHFHSGIDIKGATGQTLYAAADGYVARVKVQAGGYGNALYIRHPNGYTSVYAHLDHFSPEISSFVKSKQYAKNNFEVDLYPEKGRFTFRKGEKIGKMGVSGRSYGPHLHFEIRDSRTQKPINPLLFGLPLEDDRSPKMHQLKVYSLNPERETLRNTTYTLIKTTHGYGIKGDTIAIGAWRVGFGLKVFDHMNGVSNWNGIYSLDVYQDDVLIYNFELETFAFGESRYLNAHLDYEELVTNKSYFNRCYALPGNRLAIYRQKTNNGVVSLSKNKARKISMLAKDVQGNEARLQFWVKRKEVKAPTAGPVYNYILPYNQENIINNTSLHLKFSKGTFYQNLYMQYQSSQENSAEVFSSVHQIHNFKTPVHKYFDIAIRPVSLSADMRDKAFVAYRDKDNNIFNCGGKWKDGMLTARVRALGDYCIMTDDEPPLIQPIAFSSNMKGYHKMTFKITDNYPTSGTAKGLSYRAGVDGKWILMEYDAKNELLIHRFDDSIAPGQHQLHLVVKDNRGNKSVFEKTFMR